MNRLPIKTDLGTCTLLWEGDRVTGFRLPDGHELDADAAFTKLDKQLEYFGRSLKQWSRHGVALKLSKRTLAEVESV